MKWKELTKNEAQQIYEDAINEEKLLYSINDQEYLGLKLLITTAFDNALNILNLTKETLGEANNKYKFDCYFGKEIYKIFTSDRYSLGERDASNDDIWRYLQIKIVPELIRSRWSEDSAPRLYKQSNRLYLKTLWWYYHLSLNGDLDNTCEMLLMPCNSTDTIVALVERCGRSGYRLELYREIMKQKINNKLGTDQFRLLMVLNSARLKLINPYLSTNGIEGYVTNIVNLCKDR